MSQSRQSVPRSAGGMALHAARPASEAALTYDEARVMRQNCDRSLAKRAGGVRLKTLSAFDAHVVSRLHAIHPEAAVAESVTILADIQRAKGRGVRKQLARLILITARLARSDGYSFRAVAESAAALTA